MTDWHSIEVQDRDLRWPEGELLCFLRANELFFHQVWQIVWKHHLNSHFEVVIEDDVIIRLTGNECRS
jgi:hypothetical protein